MDYTLHQGDCLETMRSLPDNSVDAVVTDPPYGLSEHKTPDVVACLSAWLAGEEYRPNKKGFMGRTWDSWVPGPEVWREVYRVLKPGGHVLAFAGTRTQDLMCISLRLAGFEARDLIGWIYGSGFPKSMDVSKAIDKAAGAEREVVGQDTKARSTSGASALPTVGGETVYKTWDITAPATEAAKQWEGWGTALKPALEPITVARKPLIGTVAENVLTHGTGAINVDGCRITDGTETGGERPAYEPNGKNAVYGAGARENTAGRFPANIIHDGSDEVVALFPNSNGAGGSVPNVKVASGSGSAARFFYCAKASKRDRDEGNTHPTVKPTDLMAYLCRLVTPPGGVVLDPFLGSGSTGKAAMREGFRFIGCELDPEYIAIARARIEHELSKRVAAEAAASGVPVQVDMFGDAA